MSHFTHMKTHFQNLFYLGKALNQLNLDYSLEESQVTTGAKTYTMKNIVIPQSNGYHITFDWNGQEYELVVDTSFWQQSYPIESFIDKIAQHYAGEVVIGESQKLGFQPVSYQNNSDGSNTLVLERWNINN